MAKIQPQYASLTGITNANSATNVIKCDIASRVTAQGIVTAAGAPTAASIQYTIDSHEDIDAATARWVSAPTTASASFTDFINGPVTGVRLAVSASGGTWSLVVRQAYNSQVSN